MGSLKKRLSDLEVSWDELARDEEEERRLSTRRFLTRRIVAEHARLTASGESGDLVEKACLAWPTTNTTFSDPSTATT